MTSIIGAITILTIAGAICFYYIQPKIIELIKSIESIETDELVLTKRAKIVKEKHKEFEEDE